MPMKQRRGDSGKQKPFFKAALQGDGTLELLVYEDIGVNWWDGAGITAKTVKQAIDDAGAFDQILVRINSPGGDASEGIAIYNLLRSTRTPVAVCVDGIAASSASIVAMAGDTITMGPNALMMIHNAWADGAGYASDHRKLADTLDTVSDALAQTYIRRTGLSKDEVMALMDAETWLTAQDCLDQGFATAITQEADQIEEGALALARQFKLLGRMKRVPAALKRTPARNDDLDNREQCECDCQNCEDGNCDECTNVDCDDSGCLDCPMQVDAGASAVSIADARAALEDMEAGTDALPIEAAREHVESIEAILSTPEDGSTLDPHYAAFIGAGSRSNAGRW